MGSKRSLRFILFIFDALRLVAVVSALSAFRSLFSTPGAGSLGGNAVVYAAPQALFPLLLLFSWLDPVRFAPYPPLYLAGKAISAVALGTWLAGTTQDTMLAIGLGNTGVILLAATSAAVLLYDLVSALAVAYIIRSDRSPDRSEGKEPKPDAPEGERPAIVVETVVDLPNGQSTNAQGGA